MSNLEEDLSDAFWRQNYENEFFDVIFHVDGQDLYAHGHILASASDVLNEQLFQNRANGNGPLQIDNFTYDEFSQFIGLIYCFGDFEDRSMLEETIYAVIELANLYQLDEIEKYAGSQLSFCGGFEAYPRHEELDNDDIKDIFEKIEFAHKYESSWNGFLTFNSYYGHDDFLEEYFDDLIGYDDFVNLEKSAIKAFVAYVNEITDVGHEELCEVIYKWGEYQAMVTVEMPDEEKNQLVLYYIKDILPLFKFNKMSMKFLYEFVVAKGLLSNDEANEYKTIKVSITSNKKAIIGSFVDDYGIFEFIQSHKKEKLIDRGEKKCCFWDKKFKRPSKPSELKKMKGCEWYLAFDRNGKLNLKHHTLINKRSGDFIIAEMKEEKENGYAFILDDMYSVYASASR